VLIERPSDKPTSDRCCNSLLYSLKLYLLRRCAYLTVLLVMIFQVGSHLIHIGATRDPKCPAKRLAANRRLQTLWVEMQVSTPSRQPPARIGNENALEDHDAQQVGQHRSAPTPDTCADRRRTTRRLNCSALGASRPGHGARSEPAQPLVVAAGFGPAAPGTAGVSEAPVPPESSVSL